MNRVTKTVILALFALCLFSPVGETITIVAGEVDQFSIIVSERVRVAEPFRVQFIAEDKFANPITDYDQIGNDIEIRVIGTGSISPTLLLASEFKAGKATKEFVYDTAETFTLVATTKLAPHPMEQIVAGKILVALGRKKPQVQEVAPTPSAPRQELELADEKFDEAEKLNLEERLITLSKALEEKEKENLGLQNSLSKSLLEKAQLKGQLEKHKALQEQTQAELLEQEEAIKMLNEKELKFIQHKDALEGKLKETIQAKALQEERIAQLVQMVNEQEEENANLKKKLTQAIAEKDALVSQLADTKSFLVHTRATLEGFRDLEESLDAPLTEADSQQEYLSRVEKEKLSFFDKYTVQVFKVSGHNIVLPLGRKNGLEPGMMFTLYKDERYVAEIEVTELYEDMLMAQVKNVAPGETILAGDMVRLK